MPTTQRERSDLLRDTPGMSIMCTLIALSLLHMCDTVRMVRITICQTIKSILICLSHKWSRSGDHNVSTASC